MLAIMSSLAQSSVLLSENCKGCGFFFDSVRNHLVWSYTCRGAYHIDQTDISNNPEYILSGPCRACGKFFRRIRGHLSQAPQCMSAYNMNELEIASLENNRQQKVLWYQANKNKAKDQMREYRQIASKKIYLQHKKWNVKNKVRISQLREAKKNRMK